MYASVRVPTLVPVLVAVRRSALLIEDSPISRGLIQSLREQSISVTPYKPETDKRARVIAQTDLFEAGSIYFRNVPRGSRTLRPNC